MTRTYSMAVTCCGKCPAFSHGFGFDKDGFPGYLEEDATYGCAKLGKGVKKVNCPDFDPMVLGSFPANCPLPITE